MAMDAHLETLNQRHQELKAEITSEMKHPSHDEVKVQELKRLKLRIKDTIRDLKRSDP